MRKTCTIIILLLTFQTGINAQTEPEYRLEVGAAIGMVSYQGDFNGNILKDMSPMFSAVAKYRFTPRLALAMNVSFGRMKGNSKDAGTYMPTEWQNYTFDNGLVDVGFRMEYNFWPYGTGMEYRGAKRLTPYIFMGLGVTGAKPYETEIALNMPIGGGVKYKVANRVNAALEWAMHFSGTDMLDGVKDPYGIKSSGIFKNTDCYSHLRLSITYDIWAKCKTCHNDRE